MQKSLAALFVFFAVLFIFFVQAQACDVKAYGKTAEKAFKAGLELAEQKSKGQDWLDPHVQISILPEKENGLFVAEVHSDNQSNFCRLQQVSGLVEETADLEILPESDCQKNRHI